MGLLDKVKDQAKELKDRAEDKVDDVKAKRKADDLLESLGRITFQAKTDRPPSDADSETTRIVAELQKLEADGVPVIPAG
jgi:hypothetical protein